MSCGLWSLPADFLLRQVCCYQLYYRGLQVGCQVANANTLGIVVIGVGTGGGGGGGGAGGAAPGPPNVGAIKGILTVKMNFLSTFQPFLQHFLGGLSTNFNF